MQRSKLHIPKAGDESRAICGVKFSDTVKSIAIKECSDMEAYSVVCDTCRSSYVRSKQRENRRKQKERQEAGEAYCEPVTFTGTNRYGNHSFGEDDVYTVDEFRECVRSYAFIDYDGFGHPVKDGFANPQIVIKPSRLHMIPDDATHIVWYNR